MPIKVQCPSCDKRYAVKDSAGGRKMRCIECHAGIQIPGRVSGGNSSVGIQETSSGGETAVKTPDTNPEPRRMTTRTPSKQKRAPKSRTPRRSQNANMIPQDPAAFEKWLSAAFREDTIDPVPVEMSYTLALFVVGVFMIALPAVYIALIGGIVVGTWFSATSAISIGEPVIGIPLAIFLILSGLTIVLFMLKPLFSKPPHTNGRRTLSREDEPHVYAFVERICDVVGAPHPTQIEIDGTINAGASIQGGFPGFVGGDIRLLIGMPLVAGLSVQQFAGVLAHEFGHFSQGTGMRMSNLIRAISYWFARVVYERDAWDERLRELSERTGAVGGLILMLTRVGIWLTRRVLWLLMLTGHAVSGFLLRQMEFDADRYKIRVVGCKTLSSTLRRLPVLETAHQGAIGDLQQFYDEGRLADDLPQLIALNVEEIPTKLRKKIREHETEGKTRIFDTHPCTRDRIESANEDGNSGVFHAQGPAEQLFRKFGIRARGVTLDYYVEIFGRKFKKKLLRPVSELIERRKIHLASLRALRRYFQGNFSWYRRISLSSDVWTPLDLRDKSAAELLSNRQDMLNYAPKYDKAWKRYSKAEGQLIEAKLARTLIDAEFSVHDEAFSIPLTTRGQIRQAIDKLGVRQGKSEPTLRGFEEAAANRMSVALQMARSPETLERLRQKRFPPQELDELLQIYTHIAERTLQLTEIHDQQIILGKLMQLAAEGHRHDAVFECIGEQMDFLYQKISILHKDFLMTQYPFDHARADITLAEYMLKKKKLPKYTDPIALYNAAENIASSLPYIQSRVLGRLCEFAEAVETDFGLTPLDDPPDENDGVDN